MKYNYKYAFLLVFICSLLSTSCKKIINETLTTARGMDYYKTDEGLKDLATGTYFYVLNSPFDGDLNEWYYAYMNYGTDEFHVGGDASNSVFNNYGNGFQSVTTPSGGNAASASMLWDNSYIGIGDANLLIQNATESTSTSDDIKKTVLGEAYFFRAYLYLRLVSQYGAVPLKLKPSTTVELEFTRTSPDSVYQQIISDFQNAYDLLNNTGGSAKITKDAVAHYLAKAYLSRASEINDSWNGDTKEADLTEIGKLCDDVIANHPLAQNYADLWNYTQPDGPNESLPEIILSAQFTADISASGSNTYHVYFISRYDDLPYMQRDLTGDRPYSRLATSYYMYRVFDMVNDSRFWKSFRTKSRLNKASGDYYTNGDLGIMYVIDKPGDTRFSSYKLNNSVVYSKTGKTIPNVYVAYPNGTTQDGALDGDVRFPSLNKYIDGSRIAVNELRGLRDVILARSAETYLIAAEAKIRLAALGKGSYADALPYINAVRKRAQYKAGEDRSYYTDGGGAFQSSSLGQDPSLNSYMNENSYYESNNIAVSNNATDLVVNNISNLPKQDEYIIAKLGYTSDYDRMMCFLLDERSRELCGEFKRWEDLSRTKTLIKRVKAFNSDASANIKDFHLLRPIPQTYLDGIQMNGKALTADEKDSQQNPGY